MKLKETNIKPENELTEKALRLAVKMHDGQRRKGDDLPYIIHPLAVALKLARYNFSATVIAAALAHDLLEESDLGSEKLREELGDEVWEMVEAVTNDDTLAWPEKKKKYVERVRTGSVGAKAVAVADKIHNLESLLTAYAEQGPSLWLRFNRGQAEKLWFEEEVLKMVKATWEHPLIEEYEELLEQARGLE